MKIMINILVSKGYDKNGLIGFEEMFGKVI